MLFVFGILYVKVIHCSVGINLIPAHPIGALFKIQLFNEQLFHDFLGGKTKQFSSILRTQFWWEIIERAMWHHPPVAWVAPPLAAKSLLLSC